MDPFTLGAGIIGFGMQVGGMFGMASASKQAAQISQGIARDEQAINAQKYQQMLLQNRRQQLENIRNVQRQRALATASAVNQGAQYGTGLQGGLAEIYNKGTENALGLAQGEEIGTNIYNLNASISDKKMQMADVQSDMAISQGIMSLGGSLMGNAGTVGKLGKNVFG
jgi:hypothetical protein